MRLVVMAHNGRFLAGDLVSRRRLRVSGVSLVGNIRGYGLLLGLLVLGGILSILSPVFPTPANLLDIVVQSSVNGSIALGMTFVIATGGIDLSVGSIWALTSIAVGLLVKHGLPWTLAIVFGLAAGVVCGSVTGLLVTKGGVPPFIATLGTMSIYRGLALIISQGYTIYGFPRGLQFIGSGKVLMIPMPAIVLAIAFLITRFLFSRCAFGRHVVAIGGNKEAARLCGINVNKCVMGAYVVGAVLATVGGIIATARLDAAEPIAGNGAELDAIAAVVMGGTSLSGGEANIVGTLVGALVIGTVRNGLTLMNVPTFYQIATVGLIIIAAVLAERAGRSRQ
ncbi:MAG: ABC transporter permease [Bacillota bacterium]|nr:ABC transporter permease [Bacillota bacterium]